MNNLFQERLPYTRKYEGCLKVNIFFDSENECNMFAISEWVSKEHFSKYLAYRLEDKSIEKINNCLSEKSKIIFLKK